MPGGSGNDKQATKRDITQKPPPEPVRAWLLVTEQPDNTSAISQSATEEKVREREKRTDD